MIMRLEKIFEVNSQFQRSINIVSDFNNLRILDSFIVTPLSIKVATRLINGMNEESNQNAWTITGPYGAGKSASLLFIMQLLGQKDVKSLQIKLSKYAPELENQIRLALPNWPKSLSLVVPLIGTKEPVAATFLRGICQALSDYNFTCLNDELNRLEVLLANHHQGRIINEIEMIQAFSSVIEKIGTDTYPFKNIIIVFDELGKSLEYASQNIGQNDIGVLQLFGELANRSDGKFSLITVLHQAFDRYAETLNPIHKQEWSKVQGRFENIGFLESNSEILNLLQQAIKRIDYHSDIQKYEKQILKESDALGILPSDLSTELGSTIILGCLPLHPSTSLLLSRLFRSFFAQNERSLFAFISSQEPFGFQSFLKSNDWEPGTPFPLYRLNNLFDYLASSFGGSLYTLATGNKWAEIIDALERLPTDSSKIEVDLIKSIGLLELFGDQQVSKASSELLIFSSDASSDEIMLSLDKLQKLGIIVFREFKQAYGFWQGSDINLAEEFTAAFAKIDRSKKLSDYINTIKIIDPYVARKHQFTTGTLRFFQPIIIDSNQIREIQELESTNPDGGLLVIVLKNGNHVDQEIHDHVREISQGIQEDFRKRILFLIPGNLQGLREACEEVLTWQYIKNNTPALESDRIARKELALYEHVANQKLDLLLTKYFDPAFAYKDSSWIYGGESLYFDSSRALRSKLSEILDHVFDKSPVILNELINHNKISGAAAAGRNALVDKLINNSQMENLGITGFPPEMSMYLSLIKQSGLHHFDDGTWRLCPDPKHDNLNIKPLWDGIKYFLSEHSNQPVEVRVIYEFLKRPPYGLKEGVLSIFLIIAMINWESQIAIYEENTYTPRITTALCERLIKAPDRIKIQMFPTSDSYSTLLRKYAQIFEPDVDPNNISVVSAIQPLMHFMNRLPNYSLKTQNIEADTQKIRSVLTTAKNPQNLLLIDLPKAIGYSIDGEDKDWKWIEKYFQKLRFSILELQTAYEKLLRRIFTEINQSLFLSENLSEARNEISSRSHLITDWIDSLELKSFLMRLSDTKINDRQWIESIGAVLTNIPPKDWGDQDEVRFKIKLREYSQRLERIEEIIFEEEDKKFDYNDGTERIRIGFSDIHGYELSKIVRIKREEKILAQKLQGYLQEFINQKTDNDQIKVYALSEAIQNLIKKENIKENNHGE